MEAVLQKRGCTPGDVGHKLYSIKREKCSLVPMGRCDWLCAKLHGLVGTETCYKGMNRNCSGLLAKKGVSGRSRVGRATCTEDI